MDLLGLLGLDVLFKGTNALRLLGGLWVAVRISLISVAFSIVGGLLFGIFMTWKNPVAKIISRLYLEVVRIMPQLVLLFIVLLFIELLFIVLLFIILLLIILILEILFIILLFSL